MKIGDAEETNPWKRKQAIVVLRDRRKWRKRRFKEVLHEERVLKIDNENYEAKDKTF
jgi:hypothetical protein